VEDDDETSEERQVRVARQEIFYEMIDEFLASGLITTEDDGVSFRITPKGRAYSDAGIRRPPALLEVADPAERKLKSSRRRRGSKGPDKSVE
jgi:hypothetical protein